MASGSTRWLHRRSVGGAPADIDASASVRRARVQATSRHGGRSVTVHRSRSTADAAHCGLGGRRPGCPEPPRMAGARVAVPGPSDGGGDRSGIGARRSDGHGRWGIAHDSVRPMEPGGGIEPGEVPRPASGRIPPALPPGCDRRRPRRRGPGLGGHRVAGPGRRGGRQARSARPAPRPGESPLMPSTSSSRSSRSTRWPAGRDSPRTPSSGSRPRPSSSSSSRSTTRGGSTAGRSIPSSPDFDPTNETEMRALCKTWTEGSPAGLRRGGRAGGLDGGRSALHHPGGPHPLHRRVDDGHRLDQRGLALPVVDRSRPGDHPAGRGRLGTGRPSDRRAASRWGSSPATGPRTRRRSTSTSSPTSAMPASPRWSRPSTPIPTTPPPPRPRSPLVIQQLRSDGVTSVIPLIPFNVFYPVLQAETSQQYFPRLLLSDYEGSILSSLGLLPVPYAKALDGQEGVTTETLGGIDDPRPQSQGGYDPGVRSCWTAWHKAYPQVPPGQHERRHRGAGPDRRLVPGHPVSSRPPPRPPDPISTGARS